MSALNSLSAQYTDSEGEDDSHSHDNSHDAVKVSSDGHHHQLEEAKQADEESSSNLGKYLAVGCPGSHILLSRVSL